ncbi:CatA-like O-acetyltransferase [Spongiimicrobium sp. 3-5]|uniref:CatA-like O-acetyltransferase n=1 Tax=Spongiimicrobium sp. 3-5 TaxID=3332596 RepID=UPI00397F7FBD
MKEIIFKSEHRKKHFKFFNSMSKPYFNITANVDVTSLLSHIKKEKLPVTPSIVYLIAKTANAIPELRWRIREGKVVEHRIVHPSFTVFTEVADVFSFCTVAYQKNAKEFIRTAEEQSKRMRNEPSLEDEKDRDDYLFLSAIPWVSFTGFEHAMHQNPSDSVPRITWGKFFELNGKTLMPLSLQLHHAVADGRHAGKYFEQLENLSKNPSLLFE